MGAHCGVFFSSGNDQAIKGRGLVEMRRVVVWAEGCGGGGGGNVVRGVGGVRRCVNNGAILSGRVGGHLALYARVKTSVWSRTDTNKILAGTKLFEQNEHLSVQNCVSVQSYDANYGFNERNVKRCNK